ncbi:MAG TPA: protein kinase, partial [Galbitalea sp.]|nr:protein kinase [Galbitalea sp.]
MNGGEATAPAIDGFEYLSILGSGGFSDVYMYRQKLPRRKVAIKVLRVGSLDTPSRRQFVAEANLMAQLSSHPAIATIFAASISAEDLPYIVLEYCSGGSLGTTYR